MSKFDERIVTKRFVEILDDLRRIQVIKNDTEFCKKMQIMKQSLSSIRNGKRKITITLIIDIYKHYQGSPFYILFGIGEKTLSKDTFNRIKDFHPLPLPGRSMKAFDTLEKLLDESIKLQRELIKTLKTNH